MATQPEKPAVPDEKLVRRAQRGDMVAFEELIARHRDKIYARAFSMMRNEDEATDLSQEAWVKGWQRLKQFQGESSFVTWMTRIVINLPREAAIFYSLSSIQVFPIGIVLTIVSRRGLQG